MSQQRPRPHSNNIERDYVDIEDPSSSWRPTLSLHGIQNTPPQFERQHLPVGSLIITTPSSDVTLESSTEILVPISATESPIDWATWKKCESISNSSSHNPHTYPPQAIPLQQATDLPPKRPLTDLLSAKTMRSIAQGLAPSADLIRRINKAHEAFMENTGEDTHDDDPQATPTEQEDEWNIIDKWPHVYSAVCRD